MFVPQGMNMMLTMMSCPEYIMAMKFFGSPLSVSKQQFQPTLIKTRLSRKLNTGDSIVLY